VEQVSCEKRRGVSAAEFVREGTACAVGRQEAGDHEDQYESPQFFVAPKMFLEKVHECVPGLEQTNCIFEFLTAIFVAFEQVKRGAARAQKNHIAFGSQF